MPDGPGQPPPVPRLLALVLCVSVLLSIPSRAAEAVELTVDAPPALAPLVARVEGLDSADLSAALAGAGLRVPPVVHVHLLDERDPRARATPIWVNGLASGAQDVVVFPGRVGAYPYASLEAVVWHEIVHLALSAQAGPHPLPRWFQEGVAVTLERGWTSFDEAQLWFASTGSPDLEALTRFFDSGSQAQNARAYLLAAALIADVRATSGPGIPGLIADDVGRGLPFDDAFRRRTGSPPAAAAVRAWSLSRRGGAWIQLVASPTVQWGGILLLAAVAFLVRKTRRARRRAKWDLEEADQMAGQDDEQAALDEGPSDTVH